MVIVSRPITSQVIDRCGRSPRVYAAGEFFFLKDTLVLSSPGSCEGVWSDAEFAKASRKRSHFCHNWILRSDKALLVKEELPIGLMIEHLNPSVAKIHLDPLPQDRKWRPSKIVVAKKRHFPGGLVKLEDIGLVRVPVQCDGTTCIHAEDGRKFRQQASVNKKRLFVLPSECQFFARQSDFVGVTGGEKEFASCSLGPLVVAEEVTDVTSKVRREVTEWHAFAELSECQINEEIALPCLPTGTQAVLAKVSQQQALRSGHRAERSSNLTPRSEFFWKRWAT